MEKPPTPIRKTGSSSTDSISSLDPNVAAAADIVPAYDPQSRRLVDYFVVFSSKARLKHPKKKKIESDGEGSDNDKDDDDSDNNQTEMKTPPRNLCCKQKKKKKKKIRTKKNKSSKSSASKSSKSLSSSSISTTTTTTNEISPSKSSASNASKSRAVRKAFQNSNHETPILSHRKGGIQSTSTSARTNKITNASDDDHDDSNHDDDHDHDDDDDIFPHIGRGSLRVPVTHGSLSSSFEGDSDADTDEEEIVKSSSKLSLKTQARVQTRGKEQKEEKDEDEKEEEEVVTPSRMRASQGKHIEKSKIDNSNNDDNDNNGNGNDNRPDTANTSKGASENIHMPNENGNGVDNSDVYLVPVETSRYPPKDHPDNPFNPMISHFCFPNGQHIKFTTEYIMPHIHYFVLTNDRGKKMYGTCLTVYEELDLEENPDIDESDLQPFFRNDDVFVETTDSEDSIEVSLDYVEKCPPLYHPKVICLLSSWPYLHAFKEYLSQLYRLATMTNMMECPIERYILNICEEVPAPPPGMFEIQLEILNSTIRFWAPPGKQPIPYVSIPFNILFECLDLNNVLFVWYALTLENKVLLVSSQSSLLTLCAEILSALLFPMEWSHLYIPILPLFLSQMLDAPFPYLCGISRDNLKHAINDVSEETIVVDLDNNAITRGSNTPPFPPMPLKRRSKLESCLQKNVGDIFWAARGVTKDEVVNFEDEGIYSSMHSSSNMMKTRRIWKERLLSYDDAFSLAFTPDSENIQNRDTGGVNEYAQTKWDIVQEAFLTFFVTMLRDYRRFMSKVGSSKRAFRETEFINAQRQEFKPFLREFVITQQFDCFITKRMYNPKDPDVVFFDQSIVAKRNRSKMTLKKRRTPFLQSAKAQKQLRTVHAAKPCNASESNFNLFDRFYATSEKQKLSYSRWPETLDMSLLKNPRKIPDVIAAEFDRGSGQRSNPREVEFNDFHVAEVNYSIEITAFTLFFTLCCDLVGKELEIIRDKYQAQGEHLLREGRASKTRVPDCANICTFGKTASSATVDEEYTASYKTHMMDDMKNQQLSGFDDDLRDSELETAKLFAFAELDLAFSALETLFLRKLKPNVDALKALMSACGRCNCSHRATKLMHMIQERGIYVDSETYFYFLMNAPLDDFDQTQRRRKLPTTKPDWSTLKKKALRKKRYKKKKQTDDTYLEGSEHSSYSGTGSSFQDTISLSSSTLGPSSLPPRPNTPARRRRYLTSVDKLSTTDQVDKHIKIGEPLLGYLYKDLHIDSNSATCRSCGATLTEDQVRLGWRCSFTEYTTQCPHCKNYFVPSFVVKSSDPNFVGSQGLGTALHCEFLSPWVLQKEIHAARQGSSLESILDPQWRNGCDMNATIWWNLILTFQRHKLPFTFLIQGSFRERLIMPMPDYS